jgi:hypothetical protein
MLRNWLWKLLLCSLLLGAVGSVLISMSIHWWRLPVEAWLPGALSLFVVPYAISSIGCAWLILKSWSVSRALERILAALLMVVCPIAGILLSLPFLCAIAQECL